LKLWGIAVCSSSALLTFDALRLAEHIVDGDLAAHLLEDRP
jgi:hypothetical protein